MGRDSAERKTVAKKISAVKTSTIDINLTLYKISRNVYMYAYTLRECSSIHIGCFTSSVHRTLNLSDYLR